MQNKKYPRTYHLPYSLGASSDDRIMKDISQFVGREVVITEKMDGSNLCLTRNDIFARSHSGPPKHSSFNMAKALWGRIRWNIDENLSIFGEWCYAKHSIHYNKLPGYFLIFGIRNELNDTWLSWEQTEEISKILDLPTVPVLWKGKISSLIHLENLVDIYVAKPSCCGGDREGIVVRNKESYLTDQFMNCVGKWVRKDHVRTSTHWMFQCIIPNKVFERSKFLN